MRTITSAVITPATMAIGTGHHHGGSSNSSALGRSSNAPSWMSGTTVNRPQAASDTSSPMIATRTSNRRYAALVMIAAGSTSAGSFCALAGSAMP
jgi:hypothetical protein